MKFIQKMQNIKQKHLIFQATCQHKTSDKIKMTPIDIKVLIGDVKT